MEDSRGQDRVLTITRSLAALVVPVLLVAFGMLYIFPDDSGKLFAWPVKPRMSAMMLGATYLGGAYFFSRVILARKWHTVRLGFIPVTAFAAILGLATILHWDKFTPGHISFILWAILYFSLPFIIPLVWLRNQKANSELILKETEWPTSLRLAFGVLGAVMTAASLALFFTPQGMISLWGWSLSPLTARVMAAMFMLPGLVGIGAAWDGHWSSVKVILQAQVVAILLILLAAWLNRGELAWESWGSWLFIGGLLLELGVIGWALSGSRKERAEGQE